MQAEAPNHGERPTGNRTWRRRIRRLTQGGSP
jgi:hypothetical protein